MKTLENIEVTPIVEKMVENRLKWFEDDQSQFA